MFHLARCTFREQLNIRLKFRTRVAFSLINKPERFSVEFIFTSVRVRSKETVRVHFARRYAFAQAVPKNFSRPANTWTAREVEHSRSRLTALESIFFYPKIRKSSYIPFGIRPICRNMENANVSNKNVWKAQLRLENLLLFCITCRIFRTKHSFLSCEPAQHPYVKQKITENISKTN